MGAPYRESGTPEELQDFHDKRFLEGKYASPKTYPRPDTFNQPPPPAQDSNWVPDLRDEQAAQFKAELKRRLQAMPSGQRIRLLRTILGWTQGQAAKELGISKRTLIRHEQGQHRRRWMRLSLLQRLREVESDHEEQLIAHFGRV